ncbi:hypothetical protein GEMRC1_013506 [Eukaryota sp. GEM-RC1]
MKFSFRPASSEVFDKLVNENQALLNKINQLEKDNETLRKSSTPMSFPHGSTNPVVVDSSDCEFPESSDAYSTGFQDTASEDDRCDEIWF